VLALVLLLLAALRARTGHPDSRRDLGVVLVAVCLFYAVRFVVWPREPVTGLFAAWPIALLGLAVVRRSWWTPVVTFLASASALFVAAVLVSQYDIGGGFEWGGRFLSPILGPLAVVTVWSLDRRLHELPEAARRVAASVAVAVVAVPAIGGLVVVRSVRDENHRSTELVERLSAPVTLTTATHLPRIAWRADEVRWMLVSPGEVEAVLRVVGALGVPEATVVVDFDPSQLFVDNRGVVEKGQSRLRERHLRYLSVHIDGRSAEPGAGRG
jgi:hypothetical protein